MKTVVIYASKTGKTRKVAKHIAEKTGSDIVDLKENPKPDISNHDRVLVGSGIYAGKPSRRVALFIDTIDIGEKDVQMFVCCKYTGKRETDQAKRISTEVGVPVTPFGGKKKKLPSSDVDKYVAEIFTE